MLTSACGLIVPASTKSARVVAFEQTDDFQEEVRDALRQADWIEGRNLELELHLNAEATGIEEGLPALEDDVVRGRIVVLVTHSTSFRWR
jgi:hypothetical protein